MKGNLTEFEIKKHIHTDITKKKNYMHDSDFGSLVMNASKNKNYVEAFSI